MTRVKTKPPLAGPATARAGLPTDPESVKREMMALVLAFNRFPAEQVAAMFGESIEYVELMRADPDVRELLLDLRALLPKPGDINELLMCDAERNVRWLRKLREGAFDDVDPKMLRVRERAAEVLLDRQVPKKVAVTLDTSTRAIDVTPRQVDKMRALLALPKPTQPDELEPAPETPDADPA